MLLNSVDNLLMACNWLYLIMEGVLGPGFSVICINYLDSLVACSVLDSPGMMGCWGNISTTYLCTPPLLCLVYIKCSTCSASLTGQCTVPVFHVFLSFSVAVVFCVLTILYQVVQGLVY